MNAITTTDRPTVQQLQETYARAWEAHDSAAIAALHTEDSVFHTHIGMPPAVGRDAVLSACEDVFSTYHDFHANPTRLHVGTDHWALEWQMTAQMQTPAGPRPIRVDCVDLVHVSPEGLVARKDVYMDFEHVTAALSAG
ncbi:MAG: hypothetical protein NVS3B26_22640 [Mycobacteriales bacterium]